MRVSRTLFVMALTLPVGVGSRLRHVVGDDLGGGFEWFGGPATPVEGGITALELDPTGKVTRLTTVFDGRQLTPSERRALVLSSIEPGPGALIPPLRPHCGSPVRVRTRAVA